VEEWSAVATVTRALATDESMMQAVVAAIRAAVPEMGALDLDDVVSHTALFVSAGLHAVAERRGPTVDELHFVSRLASTRAGQGVPVTAMLAAIHEGQRLVWRQASERFADAGVPVTAVTEAFVSHLEWVKSVQATAIAAHRSAELEAARRERDARAELLHTLLTGDANPHHLSDLLALGVRSAERLWVVCAAAADAGASWPEGLALPRNGLSGRFADKLVAIVDEPPGGSPAGEPVALAGPVDASRLRDAHLLAERVLAAAQRSGRTGVQTPAMAALEVAFGEQRELAAELADAWLSSLDRDEPYAAALVETLLCYLDHGARLEPTAAALFVHPNTIRYRLERLQELAGIELPADMDGRVRLWWAARAWREGAARDAA
jgi:hypothetical protein